MRREQLRPVHEQVVVITGASSGIGRAATLQFARRGARVVPIARRAKALDELRHEIERFGGQAHPVAVDVSDAEQVVRAAQEAVRRFGRIDTWVNNAAVALYATVAEATTEEMQRVVDVVLMGTIHGTKAALPHLQRQGRGTIINVASVLAKRSVPLQAAYCAAKHGVKGFSESLRLELGRSDPGIGVTLVLPASIDTPLFEHARSRMNTMPRPLPPVYEPRGVASAIVFAAERRRRQITVGRAGKLLTVLERIDPRLADTFMQQDARGFEQQKSEMHHDEDNLFEPSDGAERITGRFGDEAMPAARDTRPVRWAGGRLGMVAAGAATAVLVAGASAALAAVRRRDGSRRPERRDRERRERPSTREAAAPPERRRVGR